MNLKFKVGDIIQDPARPAIAWKILRASEPGIYDCAEIHSGQIFTNTDLTANDFVLIPPHRCNLLWLDYLHQNRHIFFE